MYMVSYLLILTANVQDGFTALHTACQGGYLEIAETLITAFANVNIQNKVSFFKSGFYTVPFCLQ